MKILFTGFMPFNGGPTNPSYDCLKNMPQTVDGATIVTAELPVVFGEAPQALQALLETHKPDCVVCLGLAANRKKITPEKVGINFAHASIPDNAGFQPVHQPLIPGGPDAYFSTLPLEKILNTLEQAKIPAELSLSAGSYVCNCILYHLLTWATPRNIPAGFIHVPPETEMPLEQITQAMVEVAKVLAAQ